MGHKESIADTARVLGRKYDAIEYRATSRATSRPSPNMPGVPVYNGLTNEWHPTQMLADFLTMHESSNKPYGAIAYAFVGDCRFNMGRSLLVMGAMMGSDVRLVGPAELQPPKDVVDIADGASPAAPAPGSPMTDDAGRRVSGVDYIHTDVWVSMGEPKDVWLERVKVAPAVPGQRRTDAGSPATRT